jgi:signal transduction histidine kinase
VKLSLFVRLLLALGGCAALSIGVALVLQDRSLALDLAAGAARRIEVARRGADRLIESHLETIAARYESISGTPQFRANLEVDHPPTLAVYAEQLLGRERASQLIFTDRDGRVVASAGEAIIDASVAAWGEHTIVAQNGFPFAVVVTPLLTDEVVVGHLIAIEPIRPEITGAWSDLSGAEILFRKPDPAPTVLFSRVRQFRGIEVYVRTTLDHEDSARLRARAQLMLAGLIAFSAALLLSWFVSQGFAGPIRAIERATDKIASGDYSARVEIERNDEIGAVASSVNRMARKIQESSDAIRHANEALLATSKELALLRDRAEALGRAKSEFLAGKSPAIRSALDGILSMSELLSRAGLPVEQERYVRATQTAARKLHALLTDMLDLARLETERVQLDAVDFAPGDAVEESVAGFAETVASKGVILLCSIDAATPASVRGDPQRFDQTLGHLIGYAVRHTGRGGRVVVRVEPPQRFGDEIELRVEVEDTGSAITAEHLESLFEPLSRGGAAASEMRGSEFGLAICRRLVTLMGGHAEARNNPTGGATLSVTMRVRASPARSATTESLLEAGDIAGLRVLVVDPVRASRDIIIALLSSRGATAASEEDLARAMERLRRAPGDGEAYDAIVVHVAEWNTAAGELARALRAERGNSAMRTIAITPIALFAGTRNFDVTLARPVRRAELIAALCAPRSRGAPPGGRRPSVAEARQGSPPEHPPGENPPEGPAPQESPAPPVA